MGDGIALAKKGIPSVAVVTEEFWEQAKFVSESLGMPDAPRVRVPHPTAGIGEAGLRRVAKQISGEVIEALAGA